MITEAQYQANVALITTKRAKLQALDRPLTAEDYKPSPEDIELAVSLTGLSAKEAGEKWHRFHPVLPHAHS